jgi:O-antigen/teichoic acid export membrane protein
MHPADAPNEIAAAAGRLAGGGRALFLAQGVKFAVRAASAMTLARLLLPEDYGLFGMAGAVYGLLSIVRDLGTGAAVQQAGLTRERFDGLCRFGLLGGLVLGGICAAAGPAAARFFEEPRLPALLVGLAACFPLAGAATPLQSLLYREQRIAVAAKIDAASLAAGCAAAIAAAFAGAGAWALVVMAVATELAALALVWRNSTWLPRRPQGASSWRELLTFGAHLSGHGVAGYFTRNIDQIIVGRAAGAATLGLYGRGVQATTLPMQFAVAPFTGWIIAMLARVQTEADTYRAFFRSALNGLAHLTLPLAAVCIAAPDISVTLLYGAKWSAASPVVRWLGLGLATQPWWFAYMWLLISVGRTRRLFGLSSLAFAIFLTATLVARHSGITGMAVAVAAASVATAITTLAFSLGVTPVRAADVASASWRPCVLHGILTVVLILTGRLLVSRPLPIAAIGLLAAGLAYLAVALAVWPAVRRECLGHFLWPRKPAPVSGGPHA